MKMQILSLPATSSEKHKPQWIEFIDMQIRVKVPWMPGAHSPLLCLYQICTQSSSSGMEWIPSSG